MIRYLYPGYLNRRHHHPHLDAKQRRETNRRKAVCKRGFQYGADVHSRLRFHYSTHLENWRCRFRHLILRYMACLYWPYLTNWRRDTVAGRRTGKWLTKMWIVLASDRTWVQLQVWPHAKGQVLGNGEVGDWINGNGKTGKTEMQVTLRKEHGYREARTEGKRKRCLTVCQMLRWLWMKWLRKGDRLEVEVPRCLTRGASQPTAVAPTQLG